MEPRPTLLIPGSRPQKTPASPCYTEAISCSNTRLTPNSSSGQHLSMFPLLPPPLQHLRAHIPTRQTDSSAHMGLWDSCHTPTWAAGQPRAITGRSVGQSLRLPFPQHPVAKLLLSSLSFASSLCVQLHYLGCRRGRVQGISTESGQEEVCVNDTFTTGLVLPDTRGWGRR